MTIQFDESRDTELWVVRGDHWEIPVYARFGRIQQTPVVWIREATAMEMSQLETVASFMSKHEIGPSSEGWVLVDSIFHAIAAKAQGITPERYFRWGDTTKQYAEQKKVTVGKKRKVDPGLGAVGFLEEVARSTGVGSVPSLVMIWQAIIQVLPRWLLDGNTLDLGVVRLAALPYRHNWKTLLEARCPFLGATYASKKLSQLLTHAGVTSRYLKMTDMAQARRVNGRVIFGWTIECLPDKSWDQIVDEYESEIAASVGPTRYPSRWGSVVERSSDVIHALMAHALAEERAAAPRMEQGGHNGRFVFVLGSQSLVGTPTIRAGSDEGHYSLLDFAQSYGRHKYLEKQAANLLGMRNVRQGPEDLRDPVCDEGRPDDGMLVLDAGGSETEGQGLLVENTG